MRLGLVGFPQSGRTALFAALAGPRSGDGAHAGRPDRAQRAVLEVADHRLERVREIYGSARAVPASVEVEDLPALAPPGSSASSADGRVLAEMRNCDALVLVIRAFENDLVPHHRAEPAPLEDIADLESELLLADLDIASRRVERIRKDLRKPTPEKDLLEAELAVLERCVEVLEAGRTVSEVELRPDEEKLLRSFQFLTRKPRVVVFNVNEGSLGEPAPALDAVPGAVRLCAALERDLAELEEADRADFMQEYRVGELSAPRVVRSAMEALETVTFFTAAEKEARAWTLRRGETALDAAGKVHSDMARGFIRAEVIPFDELDAAGSLKEARARGRVRLEGKEYVVQDGDVLFIRFSA